MRLPFTSQLGLMIIAVSVLVFLVEHEHRTSLLAYIGMYVGGVLLMIRITSPQILISMMLTGIMNTVILSTGSIDIRQPLKRPFLTPQFFFRALLGIIMAILVLSVEEKIAEWLPVPDSVLFASFLIFGVSFFMICLDQDIFNGFLGLLGIFYAFQMIYMLLEGSILIFAFLTLISQLIAFLGAIFLLNPSKSQEKVEE